MTVPTRIKGGATRPLIITLIVVVVIAALGFAYASPYIALNNLKRAADARDAQTVNQYVDFPALRDSLKQQIAGMLTRRLDADNDSKLATIGAMIGVTLIGPLVDSYATPDGVAALLNGMPPRGRPRRATACPAHSGHGNARIACCRRRKPHRGAAATPADHGRLSQPQRIRRHLPARRRRRALLGDLQA
jgi:hypothetical protein